MNSYVCYMKADHRPLDTTPLDLSPLLGDWVNLQANSHHVVRANLREQNGRLFLKSHGANAVNPIDWGEVEAIPYAMGTALVANGFSAYYELNGIRVHLVANQKLGILVICAYVSYFDQSERVPHHTREFFQRNL
ncbi:MAG: hypothetical protein AAF572_28050 [Cyanobacteria bacterium P01_B01_bin.77]